MNLLSFGLLSFALAFHAPSLSADMAATGSIERIEVTTLTRQRISIVAHAVLTQVAAGTKQSFVGEVAVANIPLPVENPVWVAVRSGAGGRHEALVYLNLELGKVPEALLAHAGTHALDLLIWSGPIRLETLDTRNGLVHNRKHDRACHTAGSLSSVVATPR